MTWKSLIDKALGTNFDAPVYDASKGRAKMVKLIDLAAKQHKEGKTTAPNRMWKAGGNKAIRFSPVLNGNPVILDGHEDIYVPAERFQAFLTALKASVEAKELDKEIEAALEGETTSAPKAARAKSSKASRRGTGLGIVAQRDNPEWMAKFKEWAGEPDPSIENPVPNSKGDRWISQAAYDRGVTAAASRKNNK